MRISALDIINLLNQLHGKKCYGSGILNYGGGWAPFGRGGRACHRYF
jgi:hypothetical protein